MSRAWDFVTYTCGHADPVRGGNRLVDRPCNACATSTPGEGARNETSQTARRYISAMAPIYTPYAPEGLS